MSIIRDLVDKFYAQERSLNQGLDPTLSDADLMRFAARKGLERLRAALRGMPGAYVAERVRIRGRARFNISAGVTIGRGVLIDAHGHDGVSIGAASSIDENAVIRASGVLRNLGAGVVIGERSAIGLSNFLHGGGGIRIGDDCLLGPFVTVVSENHVYGDVNRPIREQGETRSPIVIEDDVWIGAGSTILAGVRIGHGAVVAAGAVVTSNVDPFTVVGGIPARVIAERRRVPSTEISLGSISERTSPGDGSGAS